MRTYTVIQTELGWVGLMRSDSGLCASTLPKPDPIAATIDLDPSPADLSVDEDEFATIRAAIRSQIGGRPAPISEELDLSCGTAFQQQVWCAIRSIPFGQTRSYGWIAAAIGQPLAAHAVGQAVGRNRLPLLIPCHRVVAADGSLGGFGPGSDALATKRSLLRREGVRYDGPALEQRPDFRTTTEQASSLDGGDR